MLRAALRRRDDLRMIVRVLTSRVPPGHVYAKLARRLDESGGEEVVLFEEWETPNDVWAWTGGHLTKPRLLPGTEQLVADLNITHYEALDRYPWDEIEVLDRATGLPRVPSAGA